MSAHTSGEWVLLFCTIAIVLFLVVIFRRVWDEPLKRGPGFFLGVKVAPSFYEAEGILWLRRWHSIVAAYYLVTMLAALAVFISGRWLLFPVWAGGTAVLDVGTVFAFAGYTRSRLGANPPVLPSVAIPLEPRHIGDYLSWRAETLIAVIMFLSWALLLTHGKARTHWDAPVLLSYIILGLLPFKVLIARNALPIPADRPEEHHRWMEAQRRYSLKLWDLGRWCCVTLLGGYAISQGLQLADTWLHWPLIGIISAIWLYMVVFMIRGQRRLDAMGRDLLPVGSWSTPFRRARWMPRGFAVAFGAWFGGLILLLVFFHG
jgi:hypothetical protein